MALLHTCLFLLGQLGYSGHVLGKVQKFKRASPALQARFLSARMLSANVSLVKACHMAKAIISGEYGLCLVGGSDTAKGMDTEMGEGEDGSLTQAQIFSGLYAHLYILRCGH